ncbi:MAG: PAS domain S-box protein [Polyangiaceae bacterium]|nr:PAS domain S-box protein [Polyangiaceae bacterium]
MVGSSVHTGLASRESPFDEMKRYVRFDADDEGALAELYLTAAEDLPGVAREFYERVREHEEAHAIFLDESQIARLHGTLVAWLERVLRGPYDAAYATAAMNLGRLHARVGLPHRYLFSAMAVVRQRLCEAADRLPAASAPLARRALARILDLELGLMSEGYAEARLERTRRLELATPSPGDATLRAVAALEHARVIVIGLDGEGRVLVFNRTAERVTGFGLDEVVGTSFADRLVVERADGPLHTQLAAALGGAPPAGGVEVAMRSKSARQRHVRLRVARVEPSAGGLALVVVGEDVTSERELALRVRQSEKLAAVGTLAAGLAHEIRNPLNGALLHLTLLERQLAGGVVTKDAVEAVHVVSSEIRRLSNLVSDFLDFARPRSLTLALVSVQDLCQKSLALVAALAAGAGVRLELTCPDTEIRAELDASMIEQVLLNLLQNAVEATTGGAGSAVKLRAYREPHTVVFEVRDDGPGLPSVDAPIFDAFYSSKPSGTGLGLAIVHRIVTDHGGSVDVESVPGDTVFRVTLPLVHVHSGRGSDSGTRRVA